VVLKAGEVSIPFESLRGETYAGPLDGSGDVLAHLSSCNVQGDRVAEGVAHSRDSDAGHSCLSESNTMIAAAQVLAMR